MICSLHFKLARTALGITQDQLATKSLISAQTIKRIEVTNPNEKLRCTQSNMIALIKFFEDQGVEFLDKNGEVGVRVGPAVIKKKFK